MKTLLKLTLLAAGLLAALPFLQAADAAAPAPTHRPARLHALALRRMAVRQRLANKLGLSTGQISQLKADRAQTVTAVKSIRADTNLTPEQKKTQVRDALKATRHEMLSVLTPEQQAKLRELRSRRGAHD